MKALQISLVAGAVFDAAFAIPLLIDPVKLAEIVRVPPPDVITFRLVAVLLLMATGFYLFAAIDPNECPHTLTAAVGLVLDWHVHDAKHCFLVVDQGDIDGEFAVAFDKFLGAIEWVDQPVT